MTVTRVAVGLGLCLLLAGAAAAQPVEQTVANGPPEEPKLVTAALRLGGREVRLSGTLTLELQVEGPAPLRVTVPEKVLTPESAARWDVRPAGRPAVTPLPGGRERWRAEYLLDPFAAGDVGVAVAPLAARAGGRVEEFPVAFAPVPVRVTTEVVAPAVERMRPVTDVEKVPPPEEPPPGTPELWLSLAGLGLVAALTAAWWLVRRRRRREPPPPPDAWAAGELTRLREALRDGLLPPAECLAALAEVLRGYLRRRWDVPAEKRTTGELLRHLEQDGRLPPDALRRFADVFDACDVAKFAGSSPSRDDAEGLIERSAVLVGELSREGEEGSPRETDEPGNFA
ncbi:MAG TPA: DUF4381 family protein [Gemmataceae bacterium]